MTSWTPRIASSGPRYLAIADALAHDIENSKLPAGERLPTHRELARYLGVTVGTVTRGYAEAERRGLTSGEVGRGTFVRSAREDNAFGWGASTPESANQRSIDLSIACPWISPDGREGKLFARTLRQIADETDPDTLLAYDPTTGLHRHRASAAQFIGKLGLEVTPAQIVITNGAQHAIGVILSALLRPGDTLATAELTYPGARTAARTAGLRLRGVTLDEEGIVPVALDAVCADGNVRALYCVPTLQNPTSVTMSDKRRQELAEVARKWDLILLEDEIHALHQKDGRLPIAHFAPERTLLITTLSKWATFGLRIGFVACPGELVERLRAGVRSSTWMPAPLMAEIATRWIEDGTAQRLGEQRLAELDVRHGIAHELLGGLRSCEIQTQPGSLNLWIQLPETVRTDECVAQARQRGVLVAGAGAFCVGRHVPHAIRVSLAYVPTREELRTGLQVVRDVLESPPTPCSEIL